MLLLLVCVLLCGESYADDIICKDEQLKTVVKRLNGTEAISKIKKDISILSQQPFQAVGCLINELSIVKETRITPEEFDKHKSALHIIWSIRTLRHLTGIDFRGKTTYTFKKNEKTRRHFLTLKSQTELPFFFTTMSHEVIYIAPHDTQKAIIDKWKEWYLLNGKNFEYKPVEYFDKWFY